MVSSELYSVPGELTPGRSSDARLVSMLRCTQHRYSRTSSRTAAGSSLDKLGNNRDGGYSTNGGCTETPAKGVIKRPLPLPVGAFYVLLPFN
jgi:hypothetical protein